ncbi:MAG: CCA tRNA nucleotidyltransferase [Candidatus Micrarchaeia archaeon]
MDKKKVLGKIAPSRQETARAKKIARDIQKALLRHLPGNVKTALAGSVAKGTFLKGAGDIDLFAVFPKTYTKEGMFKKLESAAKKAFPDAPRETGYAEHPYLRIFLDGKRIDLVPSYKMKPGDRIKSSVDRSQLHTEYVLDKMKPAQQREVLLLKQFLKANLLYGAEIKRKGFSGYLCELMVLYYGDFEKVLEAASKWKPPVALDPENHYGTSRTIPDFGAPLTVIDPVDLTRNVSAVITRDNLGRFMLLASSYLENPSERYFFPPALGREELREKTEGRFLFALCFERPEIVDDVMWGQLWRVAGRLESFLKKAEFVVLGTHPYATESVCLLLFELRSPVLPKTRIFRGPFLDQHQHISHFIKKHTRPFFFEHGRINAIEERELRDISLAIKRFRKGKTFPSHFQPLVPKAKFFAVDSILEDYPGALEEYFRVNWVPR